MPNLFGHKTHSFQKKNLMKSMNNNTLNYNIELKPNCS